MLNGAPFAHLAPQRRQRARAKRQPATARTLCRAVAAESARGLAQSNQSRAREQSSILRLMKEFEMERVDWLWKNWLALGKLHLIAGPPETGKTTIGLSSIATLSCGGTWPD